MGALYAPLSNDTELYSVSLALVSRALGRGKKKGKKSLVTRSLIAESGEEPYWSPVPMKSWINFPTSRRRLSEVYSANLTVASDGTGNFTSITDAVAFAPNNSIAGAGYFVIHVKEGIYRENIIVSKNKKYIMMIGEGINRTVITGNRSFVDGWTTYSSATFAVIGEGFVAINMTFQNTAGPEKHQAVAVRNNADQSTFFRCSFEGYQDTLYAHSLRQFYRECDIYGTVDFIFGNAASVFQECNLYARKPLPNQKIAFTAQGRTDPNQNTGFSIHNSSIKASPELLSDMNSTRSFLGRPWKAYSRTVYMQSFLDNVIDPSGWLEWNGTAGLDTLFYGEFQNTGPGSNTSLRVNWTGVVFMDSMEAMNFTVSNLTDGSNWLPSINVPFLLDCYKRRRLHVLH